MSVKFEVLRLLEERGSGALSGQEMAESLNVSRTAIWKAINSLREDGYMINASTNKGYFLDEDNDIISEQGIKAFLNDKNKNIPIITYKTISSTNTIAKKMAIEGALNNTVLVADEQTEGRGRYGKQFFSPPGTGIYMSIIIKPDLHFVDSQLTTIYTAVGVCKAIEKLTGETPQIKWVNDIFINGKKICGILTEATFNMESGTIESIIIGIGINFATKTQDFPDELTDIAGSLLPEGISRNMLIAAIIEEINTNLKGISNEELISEYKARSFVLGQEVSFERNKITIEGVATDINEKGNLIVKTVDNNIETLNSGEIRIKVHKTGI